MIVIGATCSCGLVPGTSEAGKAGVPEFEAPHQAPPAGGFGAQAPKAAVTTPPMTLFPQFRTTTTEPPPPPEPGEPVPSTTATSIPRWTLDEQLLRRCNAMVEFFEAGQQIELLLQRKFEPADFTARVAEARARLPKLVAELPADAIAAINATIDQFTLSEGELRAEKSIRDALYRRISDKAEIINAMFAMLFPLCPDLMGDEPPKLMPTRGQESNQK